MMKNTKVMMSILELLCVYTAYRFLKDDQSVGVCFLVFAGGVALWSEKFQKKDGR